MVLWLWNQKLTSRPRGLALKFLGGDEMQFKELRSLDAELQKYAALNELLLFPWLQVTMTTALTWRTRTSIRTPDASYDISSPRNFSNSELLVLRTYLGSCMIVSMLYLSSSGSTVDRSLLFSLLDQNRQIKPSLVLVLQGRVYCRW